MLRVLYQSIDRHRRPLRDHHYLAFPKFGIAYARVPGAPYQAVAPLIDHLSTADTNAFRTAASTARSCAWSGTMDLLTARELKRRHPEFPVFTVVQSPGERIASAYQTVIEDADSLLPTYFSENQFDKDMSLLEFIDRACLSRDMSADNLLRSQASILKYRGQLVPDITFDLAALRDTPEQLVERLCEYSREEISTADVLVTPPQPKPVHTEVLQRLDVRAKLRERYRQDYQLFFDNDRETGQSRIGTLRPAEAH
ncbi:hypothetical protein [Roseibium sp.]|uniref:hypothetical protein n=1 Tax=Roseibium sp. TaxID=1936156 RepID=UPI003A97E097